MFLNVYWQTNNWIELKGRKQHCTHVEHIQSDTPLTLTFLWICEHRYSADFKTSNNMILNGKGSSNWMYL